MSSFWNFWIISLVTFQILATVFLITWTRKQSPEDLADTDTMGHTYDGIEELNMPLPKWWLNLFYLSIFFGIGYLICYPGYGALKGSLGWSSKQQWEDEVVANEKNYAELFSQYAAEPIESLINYSEPMQVGQRIFNNNCAICHGSDAKGTLGFPNLVDNDWLYGGTPSKIKETILQGRQGNMPAFGKILNDFDVEALTHYVKSLSSPGKPNHIDPILADKGANLFQANCASCHGSDAKGNHLMGAPNLTDQTWLYGGDLTSIRHTLINGRQGNMPEFKDLLGPDKVHVVAAYIYGININQKTSTY